MTNSLSGPRPTSVLNLTHLLGNLSWRSSGYKALHPSNNALPETVDDSSTDTLLFYDGHVTQLVGFSGGHDPYLLRHAGHDSQNMFPCTNLKCRRVLTEQPFPVHFVVRIQALF
jgi:hypothetical protein